MSNYEISLHKFENVLTAELDAAMDASFRDYECFVKDNEDGTESIGFDSANDAIRFGEALSSIRANKSQFKIAS